MSEHQPNKPERATAPQTLSEAETAERQARQRKRSIAIGLGLLFLAVLFYLVTLVKFGSAITENAGS